MRKSIKRILQKKNLIPYEAAAFLSDPQWYPHLPWIELLQMYGEISWLASRSRKNSYTTWNV